MRGLATIAALRRVLLDVSGATRARAGGSQALRVLFVGNSLTTTNDLPALVETLARSTSRPLEVGRVVFDGFSLEDHWNPGYARRAIASRTWGVVVMQQGPSALPESQVELRAWATRFAGPRVQPASRPSGDDAVGRTPCGRPPLRSAGG